MIWMWQRSPIKMNMWVKNETTGRSSHSETNSVQNPGEPGEGYGGSIEAAGDQTAALVLTR